MSTKAPVNTTPTPVTRTRRTKADTYSPKPFVVPPTATRDYSLDSVVVITTPQQLKALSDKTRIIILDLLLERSATTSQLAVVLNKPKGTVGYHLKELEKVGLIRVVRTRQVRALTEKYYGRTGRTFLLPDTGPAVSRSQMLDEARAEIVSEEGAAFPMFTLRHVRIPEDRLVEFAKRLFDLAEEFVDLEPGGDTVYGLLAGIFPTDRPAFTENSEGEAKTDD